MSDKAAWLRNPLAWCVIAFSVIHLLYIGRYSYWYDELYSVSGASETSVSNWFRVWFLGDVHPPLFGFLLYWYVEIFGSSEFATRALAWFFVTSAAFWLALDRRSGLSVRERWLAAAFLAASPSAFVYSQEARSYGLLIFSGALMHVSFLESVRVGRPTWFFLIAALIGSSVHLFGVIYAGWLIAILLFQALAGRNWRDCAWLVGTGILCLFWVALLISFGDALNYAGGHHSIRWSWHVPIDISSKLGAVTTALLLLVLLVSLRKDIGSYIRENAFTLIAIGGLFASTALVSFHTPIIQGRNYLVALPAISVLIAGLAELLLIRSSRLATGRTYLAVIAVLVVAYGIEDTLWMHYRKWGPSENYRGAVEYIVSHASPGRETEVAVVSASEEIDVQTRAPETERVRIADTYYFRDLAGDDRIRLTFLSPQDLVGPAPHVDYIMSVHHMDEIAKVRALTRNRPEYREIPIRNNNSGATLLLAVSQTQR